MSVTQVQTPGIANDAVTIDKITFENALVPAGAVFHFAASSAPAGYLKCNGDVVPNGSGTVQGVTADFSALYNILGTTYGSLGKLPDLRGEFMRGWDDGRNVDDERSFGSWQKGTLVAGYDDNQSDAHIATLSDRINRDYGSDKINGDIASSLYGVPWFRWGRLVVGANYVQYDVSLIQDWTSITRPRNVALLACIKY